jgi:hypothetical protein
VLSSSTVISGTGGGEYR